MIDKTIDRRTSQNAEKFNDYDSFVDKFKPKKTTDDCYTPDVVYDAIADWVANEYGVDKATFARPFYPGGDYKLEDHLKKMQEGLLDMCARQEAIRIELTRKEDYTDKIVVDNPPFSIVSRIIQFYTEHEVPFFLFCPTLAGPVRYSDFCTVLPCGVKITYTNGAEVNTSFVTNLEPHDILMRTCPELWKAVDRANRENVAKTSIPKYQLPPEVLTSAQAYHFAEHGVSFALRRSEAIRIPCLDSMKETGKGIFGNGWLMSREATQRRLKADEEKERNKVKENAEPDFVFNLSQKEIDIIDSLGGGCDG